MENKEDEKLPELPEVPDGEIPKSLIKVHVKSHNEMLKKMKNYCEKKLKTLAMHPESPEPDFDVESLTEEESREAREIILREMRTIELEDYELRAHLEEHEELENEDCVFLLGAAAPPPPGKFKKFKSIFSKRKHEPEEAEEAEEQLEESKGWKMVRTLHKKLGNQYDNLKTSCRKAFNSKEDRPSGRRPNTPVSKAEIAREEIGRMIRDVQIMQYGAVVYQYEIKRFEGDFLLLRLYESCKAMETMNELCSNPLRKEMLDLSNIRAISDKMFGELDKRLKSNDYFLDCSKRYEEEQYLAQQKKSKGFFGKAFGSSKTPKKGKRKSGAKEDEEPLLDPSPKRTKDEADEEVIRGLRETSVTDDDDDIQDVRL